MEGQFTIQLSFQEGRKLGLILVDTSSNDDYYVVQPAHQPDGTLNGVVKSVASKISNAVVAAAQTVASPARVIRHSKRNRETQITLSPHSIIFAFAANILEAAKTLDIDDTDFNSLIGWANSKPFIVNQNYNTHKVTNFNEQTLLYALTGAIKPMDEIEKIQYRKGGLEKSSKPLNRTHKVGRRRSHPYYRSNYYKTFFCCNASGLEDVISILSNPKNYPLYITLKRTATIDVTGQSVNSSLKSPSKRQKTNNSVQQQQANSDGVICLLDSSDEEDNAEKEGESKASGTTKNGTIDKIDESMTMMSIEPHEAVAPKDPPLLHFEDDTFVITPYGCGKILTSRVERQALVTNNDATIFRPIRMYSIDLHFGTCHLPASQIKPMTGSSYEKTIFTYQKVPLNEHDLLRLRPMTYLNDSIINFYLKFVKQQVDEAKNSSNASKKADGLWNELDGEGIHIFPSYCYTRIQSCMSGNRNTKANRDSIWKDLKSWTKQVDIFKKRLLVFPINESLHWTVCIVCHPGRFIRRYSKECDEKKKSIYEKTKEAYLARLDSNSPLADDAGIAPLSLLPILNGNRPTEQEQDNETSQEVTSGPVKLTAEGKKVCSWQCDYCPIRFETYDIALEHESICNHNIDWGMIHFDSGKHFKLHKSTEILGNIRKYLNAAAAEYEPVPGVPVFTTKNMPGFSATVPQQDNAKDCGVYMLEMAERMMRNPPEIDNEFVKKKGASKNFFGINSFSKDVIVQKREDILQLIQRLRREETCL